MDGTRVRIPAGLVDDALAAAPRSVPLTSRSGAGGLTLEAGPVYYGTGSDCLYLLGPGAKDRRPVSLADVEGAGGGAGEAAQHRLRDEHGAPARALRRVRARGAVRGHAARDRQAAHHGARVGRRHRPLQRDGGGLRRGRQLGPVRHADAAARARRALGGPARALRRARRAHGLRHGPAARGHRPRLQGRLPRAHQRRDAERARDLRAREARGAVRVRSRPRCDEPAHRARAVLRARGDGGAAGLRGSRPATTTCRPSATAAAPTP